MWKQAGKGVSGAFRFLSKVYRDRNLLGLLALQESKRRYIGAFAGKA